MTQKINMNKVADKSELAMMGYVVPVSSNEEAVAMIDYIQNVIQNGNPDETGAEVLKNRINKYGENTIKHMVVNTLMGEFAVITFTLDSEEEEEPFPEDLADQYGVFCYCYNVSAKELSELGYCFFKKEADGFYHRIG